MISFTTGQTENRRPRPCPRPRDSGETLRPTSPSPSVIKEFRNRGDRSPLPSLPGKNFPDGKSGFSENFPFPVLPGKYFPAQFRIFRFQNSKIHKNENWIFPTGFCCFPVGFRCFLGGKDCFSNVKNILVYMVLQKNYYTCIYNLNTKYPFKFRKNNISLT